MWVHVRKLSASKVEKNMALKSCSYLCQIWTDFQNVSLADSADNLPQNDLFSTMPKSCHYTTLWVRTICKKIFKRTDCDLIYDCLRILWAIVSSFFRIERWSIPVAFYYIMHILYTMEINCYYSLNSCMPIMFVFVQFHHGDVFCRHKIRCIIVLSFVFNVQ